MDSYRDMMCADRLSIGSSSARADLTMAGSTETEFSIFHHMVFRVEGGPDQVRPTRSDMVRGPLPWTGGPPTVNPFTADREHSQNGRSTAANGIHSAESGTYAMTLAAATCPVVILFLMSWICASSLRPSPTEKNAHLLVF